jgi:hypothetical protein
MHAARRQDHAPPDQHEPAGEALAAVSRMEAEVTAALRRIGGEPGRENDITELVYVGRQLGVMREAIEAEGRRRFRIAAAYKAGEAAGVAKAEGRRMPASRPRPPGLSAVPAVRAG